MISKKIQIGIAVVVVIVIFISFLPTFIPFKSRKTEQRLKNLRVKGVKSLTLSNYSSMASDEFTVIQKGKKIEIKDKKTIDRFCKVLKSLKGISVNHPSIIGKCDITIKADKDLSFDVFITRQGQVFATVLGEDRYNYRISSEFTSFIRDVIMKSKERNPRWFVPDNFREQPPTNPTNPKSP